MNIFRKTAIAASIYLIGTATFAGSVDANVNVFGASSALTINATVRPTVDFVSNNSKLYLAIVQGADVYFYSETAGFVPYAGGLGALTGSNPAEAQPVRSITKGAETITLTGDARAVKGADIYVGYGASFAELISNARYTKLYTLQTRPEDAAMNCVDNVFPYPIANTVNPDFQFSVNPWGVRPFLPPSAYSTCTGAALSSSNSLVGRYTWDFKALAAGGPSALGTNYLKGYPNLSFGWMGYGDDVSPTMPKQVSTITSMPVSWDVTINHHISQSWVPPTSGATQVGDGGNLLLEVWFGYRNNDPSITGDKHSVELGIKLLEWGSMDFNSAGEERVTIDGIDYMYHLEPPTASVLHSFAVLTAVNNNITAGQLNVVKYVEFLKARGLVVDSDYVMSITLGSEISEGAGEVLVNKFSVTVN
jgi:hypothetical protein